MACIKLNFCFCSDEDDVQKTSNVADTSSINSKQLLKIIEPRFLVCHVPKVKKQRKKRYFFSSDSVLKIFFICHLFALIIGLLLKWSNSKILMETCIIWECGQGIDIFILVTVIGLSCNEHCDCVMVIVEYFYFWFLHFIYLFLISFLY